MLFNSYEFILGFLPVTVLVFLALGRHSRAAGARLADPRLGVLLRLVAAVQRADHRALDRASTTLFARALLGMAGDAARARRRTLLLVAGIVFNVCFLGYFKYVNFVGLGGQRPHRHRLRLTQRDPAARHLVHHLPEDRLPDRRRTAAASSPSPCAISCLFVMFFPQLIAGPIMHYREMMPQFQRASCRFDATLYAVGLTLFCFGLFKKVVLADGIALHVTPVFAYAASGAEVTLVPVLAGRGRLHPADLLRLLRLLRHGVRRGAVLRRAVAAELLLAAQGHEHHRLLAALAHHADPLPDRLRLQPDRPGADPAAGDAAAADAARPRLGSAGLPARARLPDHHHHADLRPLARRGLHLPASGGCCTASTSSSTMPGASTGRGRRTTSPPRRGRSRASC